MPLENRVNPFSETFVTPARGTLMGNRGILHDDQQHVVKRWAHQAWIICLLEFKGRRRTLMAPGSYTELFFLDEATALAAGHRPCGECQRQRYLQFKALFEQVHGRPLRAPEMDRLLHDERRIRYRRTNWRRTFSAELSTVPDGAMIARDGDAFLVWGGRLLQWTPGGYAARLALSAEAQVTVLTPHSTVAVLRLGFVPSVHPSAA